MKNYGPMNPRSRIEYMKEIDVMAYQRWLIVKSSWTLE